MPARGRRVPVLASILACGLLVSVKVGIGTTAPAAPPAGEPLTDLARFSVDYRPGRLEISGAAASAGHERELLRVATTRFGGGRVHQQLEPGLLLPPDWQVTTTHLLEALAATEAATATITETAITARGVTADAASLAERLDRLRDAAGGFAIATDFIVVDAGIPLQDLCRRNLEQAVTGPVTFAESETAIRTSSYALLDRVVEIANECRDFAVTITGHSDASGSDAWNRHLSLARAEAVADYLVTGGVDPARIMTRGLGSSQPVADNATAAGRSRNRRIEFSLQRG